MQRKQGLIPIGEALADLPGPVKAILGAFGAFPQALHHLVQVDQIAAALEHAS